MELYNYTRWRARNSFNPRKLIAHQRHGRDLRSSPCGRTDLHRSQCPENSFGTWWKSRGVLKKASLLLAIPLSYSLFSKVIQDSVTGSFISFAAHSEPISLLVAHSTDLTSALWVLSCDGLWFFLKSEKSIEVYSILRLITSTRGDSGKATIKITKSPHLVGVLRWSQALYLTPVIVSQRLGLYHPIEDRKNTVLQYSFIYPIDKCKHGFFNQIFNSNGHKSGPWSPRWRHI